MSDGGKGSAPRPFKVDHETFSNNWDAIFGKSSQTKTLPQTVVGSIEQWEEEQRELNDNENA